MVPTSETKFFHSDLFSLPSRVVTTLAALFLIACFYTKFQQGSPLNCKTMQNHKGYPIFTYTESTTDGSGDSRFPSAFAD